MDHVLYVAMCVIVPLAWGLLVVAVSNRIDSWAKKKSPTPDGGNAMNADDATRVEYHI